MNRIAMQRRLGRKIRDIRKSRGLSQAQLARLCQLAPVRLWIIENGLVNLTLSTLVHLSRHLDLTVAELVRGID